MQIRQVEPDIGRREIQYVKDCLKRRWITEGKYADLLLSKIRDYTGANYAVLAPNGTLALYMSLLALGVKSGDGVLVPDITFNATASVLPFVGATPVFCDVDRETMQMDVKMAEELINDLDIKAVMPVHLYGQPVDMKPLLRVAKKKKIIILEDSAQGLGVHYYMDKDFHHVGTMGDAGIFAFFADKNIIMGEGGVVVTNDEDTYYNLRYLRNQGRLKSGSFEHERVGMNFRITDMQCAVGYAQMERIDELLSKKIEIYAWYETYLPENVKMMKTDIHNINIPLRCPIIVEDKNKVIEYLAKNGVSTRELEYPLHRQPCWSYLGADEIEFENADYLFAHGIKLPFHTSLRKKDVKYICQKIKECV